MENTMMHTTQTAPLIPKLVASACPVIAIANISWTELQCVLFQTLPCSTKRPRRDQRSGLPRPRTVNKAQFNACGL